MYKTTFLVKAFLISLGNELFINVEYYYVPVLEENQR